ncbi:Aminomethyltransferase folate-binding domain-containing protein [Ascodesmis nigricans]|uniref:Iron-sulfur cluster assembly factor IBA57 homolog, mitochondrial n=1 Tax=Ascodesmis nigricans TaxID=341454 RepID=A0A4S2N5W7_9PEZI|nr:Aminomethyltransferase folate-binding domain-containing protein [Ascodesmis nigricans]
MKIRIRPSALSFSVRSFSTTFPRRSTSLPPVSTPPNAGITNLNSTRRLILLQGPDVPKFLQGITTINVPNITGNKGVYCAFLNSKGRVLFDTFLYPAAHSSLIPSSADPAFIIEADVASTPSLLTHLKRYKLRSKFTIRALEPEKFTLWATWNTLSSLPASIPKSDLGLIDQRAPNFGRRLILPQGSRPEVDADEVDGEVYRLRRYLNGIPEGQAEIIGGSALPQESCMDYMGGIDFRKGCYVGQELTIRTHHTGVVRKRILPVMLYPSSAERPQKLDYTPGLEIPELTTGADIKRVNRKGRSAGKFLARVGNVGLGLCRLEVMTDVKLSDGMEGGWKEEDEFRVERNEEDAAEEIRIKAFVPSWHMLGNTTASQNAPVSNTPLSLGGL